jgi:hypothetical protein
LGGIVADFLFEYFRFVFQVQGPTHKTAIREAKDNEQWLALELMGYRVFFIPMSLIYNQQRFEHWMRQTFNLNAHHYSEGAYGQLRLDVDDPAPGGLDGFNFIDWWRVHRAMVNWRTSLEL